MWSRQLWKAFIYLQSEPTEDWTGCIDFLITLDMLYFAETASLSIQLRDQLVWVLMQCKLDLARSAQDADVGYFLIGQNVS